ncbi:MAG TPA: hypothetical protein DEB40_12665, partial [Elusimicrobia bacterium]|nr:hypothetical protein [Elusimicrobiota bacterium]
ENHVYRVDERTVPSVSSILDLYFPPIQFYTEEGRMLGTARHEWFHAIIQGIELENEPDELIAGAVDGFRKFMSEVKPVYISGEKPYFDEVLGVCGTPDLVAEIGGVLSVCDFKPSAANKRTRLQLAAYFLMLQRNNINVVSRYELRLSNKGAYRLEEHKDYSDMKRWASLVAAYNAMSFYR